MSELKYHISPSIFLTFSNYRGRYYMHIRKYVLKAGEWVPTRTGVCFDKDSYPQFLNKASILRDMCAGSIECQEMTFTVIVASFQKQNITFKHISKPGIVVSFPTTEFVNGYHLIEQFMRDLPPKVKKEVQEAAECKETLIAETNLTSYNPVSTIALNQFLEEYTNSTNDSSNCFLLHGLWYIFQAEFRNNVFIHIRKFYVNKEGEKRKSKYGISLSTLQLAHIIGAVDELFRIVDEYENGGIDTIAQVINLQNSGISISINIVDSGKHKINIMKNGRISVSIGIDVLNGLMNVARQINKG
ncbi:hypothetical protein PCE1_004930 [Barthelona sp. PCE]